MSESGVHFLVFDIESVADGNLVSKVRYPKLNLSPIEAIQTYRAELIEKSGSDFIPYTFHLPVAVVAAKVDANMELLDVACLDHPEYRPHMIVQKFWEGWEYYKQPTLVSFNGRGFDVPVLELSAYRFGLSIPKWFNIQGRSYEQSRNRYNIGAHLDLHDVLTNFGATRFNGGLDLAASMVGKPGKMDTTGSMVQDFFNEGRLQDISDYCRCDVLDTYFIFLRVQVMIGAISLDREQEIIEKTHQWLTDRVEETPIYGEYLSQWTHWENPWAGEPMADGAEKL